MSLPTYVSNEIASGLRAVERSTERRKITINETSCILEDGRQREITMSSHNIKFGCTDIQPEVVLYLAERYKEHFTTTTVTLQTAKP